jgi:branched-chain amino acid transport system permease protein
MDLSEAWQLALNGLVNGSFYGLLAAGFGLILGVTGRFHFAYASSFVLTAYVASVLQEGGVPLVPAIVAGLAAGMALGVAVERVVYRPLVARAPSTALLAVFVSSLGVTIIVENTIRLIWGSTSRSLGPGFSVSSVSFGSGASLTTLELLVVAVSLVLVLGLWWWLRTSARGRAIRAVKANPDMARVVGVDPDRVYLLVFAIGSLFAGVGAVLFTMRYAALPDAGAGPTFTALVVTFVAGLSGNPLRYLAAGVVVGVVESLSNLWISSTWNPVVVFGLLFLYIALAPVLGGRGWRVRLRPTGRPEAT